MSSENPETVKPETRKPRDKAAENEWKSLECSQEFMLNHSSVTLEQNKPTVCSPEIVTCRPNSFIFLKFDKVLYQFLEIGTSDMTFMGRDQELK